MNRHLRWFQIEMCGAPLEPPHFRELVSNYPLHHHPLIGWNGGGDEAAAKDAGFVIGGLEDAGLTPGDAFFRIVEKDGGCTIMQAQTRRLWRAG